MAALSEQLESIPGFGLVSAAYEEFAPEYIKTKDPFYVKENGEEKRRKAPPNITEVQKKLWKQVIHKAWRYDRNFCCGCIGFDIGVGVIPIINIIPVIGPILAYTMQGSLISLCTDAGLPPTEAAKMGANCVTDFIISLVPILGILFCWLYGCATRNAALFDTWLRNHGDARKATQTQAEIQKLAHQRAYEEAVGAQRQNQSHNQRQNQRPSQPANQQAHSRPARGPPQTASQGTQVRQQPREMQQREMAQPQQRPLQNRQQGYPDSPHRQEQRPYANRSAPAQRPHGAPATGSQSQYPQRREAPHSGPAPYPEQQRTPYNNGQPTHHPYGQQPYNNHGSSQSQGVQPRDQQERAMYTPESLPQKTRRHVPTVDL